MRVVQTEITDTEHALLETYVKAHNTTIKEAVREAIRTLTIRDQIDPDDPVFRIFPLVRGKGKLRKLSEDHDRHLYGGRR